MESVYEKGPEESREAGNTIFDCGTSSCVLCFAGGVRTAVRGRRESGGSDAPARRGRDSPRVQQQGQRPHGFRGQGPEGPRQQPSLAAPRLADVSSAKPAVQTAARA